MLLQIKNYSVGYYSIHYPIIGDINFSLNKGDIIGLTGRNGCGKSSLLKGILGLTPYRKGNVILKNKFIEFYNWAQIAKLGMFGYLPQRDRIFLDLTVKENLSVPHYNKISNYNRKIEQILKEPLFVDLFPRLNENASLLSGGQKLILALACLTLFDPPILFLDEPSDGLDKNNQNNLIKLLNKYRSNGKSIIIAEQNLDILNQLGASIYAIEPVNSSLVVTDESESFPNTLIKK